MIIKTIHGSPGTKYIREAVYSCVDILREYREFRDSPDDGKFTDVMDLLDNNCTSPYQKAEAAKIAFIHLKYQKTTSLLLAILLNPDLLTEEESFPATSHNATAGNTASAVNKLYGFTAFSESDEMEKVLTSMKTCPPAGVVTEIETDGAIRSCDIYQLCPWCRYRKATAIYRKLRPLLQTGRKITVVHVKNLVDGSHLDNEFGHDNHKKLMDAWRAKNKYVGGYTITLPEWHMLHDYQDTGSLADYSLTLNTYVIAITDESDHIKAFHNCAPATLDTSFFLSNPSTPEWKANIGGLRDALKSVMKHPLQMLAAQHALDFPFQIETVIQARSYFESTVLGKARESGLD
jgi:hypothetical protein